MRILFLSPAANLGGAERCLLDLMASIVAFAPKAKIGIIAGADGPLLDDAAELGVDVMRLPFGVRLASAGDSAFRLRSHGAFEFFTLQAGRAILEASAYALRLRTLIRAFAPSVVHSNGNKMHLLGTAARGQAPLIWHIHDFISERPVISRAMRQCAWRADGAIAISNAVSRDISHLLPRLPITTVLNAVNTQTFAPTGPVADLDGLAGCGPLARPTVRVGLVATDARWKGHDVFLEAARRITSRPGFTAVRFYIIGGPIYETAASQYTEEELRDLVRHHALSERVCFVPFHRRIDEVYRALDIVVHASSRPEPFGRTIAEGMATGRPVVVSSAGGASELFTDGIDAVGVVPGDAPALANALVELILDPLRRTAMAKRARATAIRVYSGARLAERVFRAYRAAGVIEI
jgi:glycosyltransferase involved in cell wall biosynthesis